jgi:hypothetical protein
LIWLALAAGIIAGQFLPLKFREWVRGVAGKARELVLGAAPAPALKSQNLISNDAAEVRPPRPNKSIEALKGFLAGVGNMAAFVVKHPILLIGLALVAFWLIAGSSCARLPFGKSADTLRAERDAAESVAVVRKHERDMSDYATNLSERSNRDRDRTREIVDHAEQDLADAVEQADFDALWRTYDGAYRGMWDDAERPDSPNPAPGRPEILRGADAYQS